MRRLRVLFAAGALVTLGALAVSWCARAPRSAAPAPAPSPSGVAPEVKPNLPAPAPPVTPAPEPKPPPAAAPSRADAQLIALEDKALRRIDVVALLEQHGIDPRELGRRPDADDLLRHLAADELLTRLLMRQIFALRVYPTDYPREAALSEARTAAETAVADMSPGDRVKYLTDELASPDAPPPEPRYALTP